MAAAALSGTLPPNAMGATRAVNALAALAQETRLSIFRLLVEFAPTGLTPGAIVHRMKLAPATLSFHLKELANAGLIADRRDGRFIWYQADLAAMDTLVGYLTEHCCRATGGADCGAACAPAVCRPSPTRTRNKR
jgi:ArsR family transcriptional regulator, arsenate/arsenite/antimonite-responsive transcriptional repressor